MTDAYGDIDLLDLRAQEMEIKLESGRLEMERVEGGSCTVADEYGNASFAQVTLSGDMQVHMESGDVCFRDTVMRGLELKNAYGSVDGEQAVFGDMQISVESGDCLPLTAAVSGRRTGTWTCGWTGMWRSLVMNCARNTERFKSMENRWGRLMQRLRRIKNHFLRLFVSPGILPFKIQKVS